IAETHGTWRLVSVAIFIAHKKGGTLAPMYFLSSQTEILKSNKIKAKRGYQSSPTEGKRKKTCPNRIYFLTLSLWECTVHKQSQSYKKTAKFQNLLWA
ncbi:MAG: hypothetical protein ACLTZX_12575, partial [Bacteroides ovatus]